MSNRCADCEAPAEIYDHDIPLCLPCLDRREAQCFREPGLPLAVRQKARRDLDALVRQREIARGTSA